MASLAIASSPAESGVTMPSPLKRVFENMSFESVVSSILIDSFEDLPMLSSTLLALFSSLQPSTLLVSKAERGRVSLELRSKSLSFNMLHIHSLAFTTSFTRILPSWSLSRYSKNSRSNSRPSTGQLSAVQSFWSNSPKWAMSSPLSIRTLVTPPKELNFHG